MPILLEELRPEGGLAVEVGDADFVEDAVLLVDDDRVLDGFVEVDCVDEDRLELDFGVVVVEWDSVVLEGLELVDD